MFKNAKQFSVSLTKRLKTNPAKNVASALQRSGDLVRNTAVMSIVQNPRRGPEVRRRGQTFNISAAGDPPAQDQGILSAGITMEVKMSHSGGEATITTSAPYSAALEFGTVNMAARPFMLPALQNNRKKILEIFKRRGIIR